MGLNRTSESKLLPFEIRPSLPCLFLGVSIGFRPYAEIQRKGYGRLHLWWASFFNNNDLNISLTSIRQSSQKLWLSKFASVFGFHFWAPWYIMGLNRSSNSKLLPVGIRPSLSCWFLGVSIGFWPYAEIPTKGYGSLYLRWASFFNNDGLNIS